MCTPLCWAHRLKLSPPQLLPSPFLVLADDLFRTDVEALGGNKLAKIKGAAFKKIFEDFQENAGAEGMSCSTTQCG